jgi:hypothetical protein
VSKECALQQRGWDRSAIYGHEPATLAKAGIMNGLRDNFLASSCLASHENGAVNRRYHPDFVKNGSEGATGPNQFGDSHLSAPC